MICPISYTNYDTSSLYQFKKNLIQKKMHIEVSPICTKFFSKDLISDLGSSISLKANNRQDTKRFYDSELAKEYGFAAAVIINHLQFWIRKNIKNKKNFIEGRTWTYQAIVEIAKVTNISIYKVKYSIRKLIKKGILIKNRFNRMKIDRTNWYAFKDENLFHIKRDYSQRKFTRHKNDKNSNILNKIFYMFIRHWTILSHPLDNFAPPIPEDRTYKKEPPTCIPSSFEFQSNEIGGGFLSEKKEQNSINPYECLNNLRINNRDKIRLTKKFTENIVQRSVQFVNRSGFKLKTTLDRALFHYCKNPNQIVETQENVFKRMQNDSDEKLQKSLENKWFFESEFRKKIHNLNYLSRDTLQYVEVYNYEGTFLRKIFFNDLHFYRKMNEIIVEISGCSMRVAEIS